MTSPSKTSEAHATAALRTARPDDSSAVEALLRANRLPFDGVAAAFDNFLVAESHGLVVGAVGLEVYEGAALLRSAVVADEFRGTGLGSRLVHAAVERAAAVGAREVFLLTTTAENYFPRFGFERVTRAQVPDSVRQSVEFTGACPESAIVMRYAVVGET